MKLLNNYIMHALPTHSVVLKTQWKERMDVKVLCNLRNATEI